MQPGTSALVAITSQAFLDPTRDYISQYDAQVTAHDLGEDMAAHWREGEDVTHKASLTDDEDDEVS